MTVKQFRDFRLKKGYVNNPIVVKDDKRFAITPNQACSIEELMIRQSQGLPMPNLTPVVHTAFNGYDLDSLPVSARKNVDMIDVMNDLKRTSDEIQKTEHDYRYEVMEAVRKLNKGSEEKDNKN